MIGLAFEKPAKFYMPLNKWTKGTKLVILCEALIVYKWLLLFVTWNHVVMRKLILLDRNTWNHITMQTGYYIGIDFWNQNILCNFFYNYE